MTKQLKVSCMIYIAGIAVYAGAVYASIQYTLEDRVKFLWFLASYLIIGFETFRRLEESLMHL